MDQFKSKDGKDTELKKGLKAILAEVDLRMHQEKIRQLSKELHVSAFDCSTALLLLHKPECLVLNKDNKTPDNKKHVDLHFPRPKQKSVRYRMEIGRIHEIEIEELKSILVEVSGVEYNRIGRLEIRNHYTLVDLPEGMPADIFQLLSETEIKRQRLDLKRVKFQRRTQRRKRKRFSTK